jgi:integrase
MGVKVREKDKDSGIWWVFINYKGKRSSRQIGTKKAADKVKEHIEARLKLGQDALPKEKPSSPTLKAYWQGFEDTYLPLVVCENTMASYRQSFRIHILPELGNLRIDEITRDQVKAFIAKLTQKLARIRKIEKFKDETTGKMERRVIYIERSLSRSSIRIILAALSVVLNNAVEDGRITTNHAGRLGKYYKQAKNLHEEIQPLTQQEVPLFLEAVRTHFPEYFPLFLAAIHTGMRSGELAALRWSDIDFAGKFIRLQKNVARGKVGDTKTRKSRCVDISDELLHTLEQLRRSRKAEYLRRGKNEIPEWVFLGPGRIEKDEDTGQLKRAEGQRVDMQNVKNRVFHKCLEKAGLRRIRFHELRHTYATLLLMQGESPAYVKDQLGHSSIKMTVDIYGHWIPGANRQAVNRLPGLHSHAAVFAVAAD